MAESQAKEEVQVDKPTEVPLTAEEEEARLLKEAIEMSKGEDEGDETKEKAKVEEQANPEEEKKEPKIEPKHTPASQIPDEVFSGLGKPETPPQDIFAGILPPKLQTANSQTPSRPFTGKGRTLGGG